MVLNLRLQPMFVHILIVVEKKPLLLFEVELLRHVQQQCSLHYGSFIKCVKFFSKGKFLKKIILVFFFNAHKVTCVSKIKLFMICSQKLPQMVLHNISTVVAGFCNPWKNIFMKSPLSFLNSSDFFKLIHNKCSWSKLPCYGITYSTYFGPFSIKKSHKIINLKKCDIFRYFKAVSSQKFINQGPKEIQVCTLD